MPIAFFMIGFGTALILMGATGYTYRNFVPYGKAIELIADYFGAVSQAVRTELRNGAATNSEMNRMAETHQAILTALIRGQK